ncbi:NAD(P)/FAD-dependent oxidoreductase [Rhodovibrio salinarum]|uniref:FAD-dependent oxidoreductase n=1 Tax=Rhodovibrio salinarum TaxID=1087 RepID=A0A934QI63_9PROT|nr:FAD-dependent oxidoreductase [Rhodovibrio salinarum]MBK1697239.1 FAD-dependent oxidoreductase [Rhodovibrio salinarum]
MSGTPPTAVVIGAGVIGLSAARALLATGYRVEVIEQGPVPNAHGSSVDSGRLIRHTYGTQHGYAALVDAAYAAWERLWADLGETHYTQTGTLMLSRPGASWAQDSAATLDRLGKRYRVLDRGEAARRFPLLNLEGVERAYWVETGGVLAAEPIIDALARHLRVHGGAVTPHTAVTDIDAERGHVRLEDGSHRAADLILVAAGPWAGRLWPELDDVLTPSRQLVCYADIPDDLYTAWRRMPMVLDIGEADSRTQGSVYAVPPVGDAPLKLGDHAFSLTGDPDVDRSPSAAELQRLFEMTRRQLAEPARYRLLSGRTCFYTVAPDSQFLHRCQGRAHVLAGFSGHGFKFGPLIGERFAELASGRLDETTFQTWLAARQ